MRSTVTSAGGIGGESSGSDARSLRMAHWFPALLPRIGDRCVAKGQRFRLVIRNRTGSQSSLGSGAILLTLSKTNYKLSRRASLIDFPICAECTIKSGNGATTRATT
jgi:hypothetical protein